MFTSQILRIANAHDLASLAFNYPGFSGDLDAGNEESTVDCYLENAVEVWEDTYGVIPSPGIVECARVLLLAMAIHETAVQEENSVFYAENSFDRSDANRCAPSRFI